MEASVPRRNVHAEILEAAEALAIERGFGGVTTKEVARRAGCSEGSIYNHFRDRNDLLARVVARRVAAVTEHLAQMTLGSPAAPGEFLTDIVHAVAGAYGQLIALSTSLVADPEVRARFNEVLEEGRVSPEDLSEAVAALITTAQEGGLVRRDVEADAVAVLITGACHQAALHSYLAGEDGGHTDGRLARTLETLLAPG
jgi:AcrR family transcriptional regulator